MKVYLTEEQINKLANTKTELTILWLDDLRDPNRYLNTKPAKPSGAWDRNTSFYNGLSENYNFNFIWVKNFDEFTGWILKHGVPEFVSFDHDLGKGLKKGADCAMWLLEYCRKNGISVPKIFAHSANRNGREEINSILNNPQTSLKESVYVNGVDTKNKKVNLTYNKNNRMVGRVGKYHDNVKTDKMDKDDSDTYEVDLKGGIKSYNITSINGTKVMHYFKNYFKKEATSVDVVNRRGNVEKYEMELEKGEFNAFMDTFIKKVNNVVNHCESVFETEAPGVKFNGISIYPVKSSSNFNVKMAEEIRKRYPGIYVIDENLFNKNLANLKKDIEFIEKNKNYYQQKAFVFGGNDGRTGEDMVDNELNRLGAIRKAQEYVTHLDRAGQQILSLYNNRKQYIKNGTYEKHLLSKYLDYYNTYLKMVSASSYFTDYDGKNHNVELRFIAKFIKYSKGPSIERRSGEIWSVLKPFLQGKVGPDGKPYRSIEIGRWEPEKFQIKNSYNNVRMGLRGYYSENPEIVKKEMEKIRDSLFIIFDDNISGGATLADVCLLAKQIGMKYLIPITFGEMEKKYTAGLGKIKLLEPNAGTRSGFVTDFEYQD